MPAFLTHWHVLIETARRSEDTASATASLLGDGVSLRRRAHGWVALPQTTPTGAIWQTGPLPAIDFRFPGSDIAAMAYLGALAPAMTCYAKGGWATRLTRPSTPGGRRRSAAGGPLWADLLHHHRSGDVIMLFLESIAAIPAPALRTQALAFALGYLSHIAADLALHPYINALVALYQREHASTPLDAWRTHLYIEDCIDAWLATRYFGRRLASLDPWNWLYQPWRLYIEPAAQLMLEERSLSRQVLEQFVAAAAETYHLSEEELEAFRHDHLAGLRRLRRLLAGHSCARWRSLRRAGWRRGSGEDLGVLLGLREPLEGMVTVEEVLAYAIRLSERLCRRALALYAVLRDSTSNAAERRQRRSALGADLRNWNLVSGYDLVVDFDGVETVQVQALHNWLYFADQWHDEPRLSW